jgi:hypothetical protein
MFSNKTILRAAACILAAVALASSPSWAYKMMYNTGSTTAQWVNCNNLNGFSHWNQGTISFYHNTSGAGAGKATAIQNAMAEWTNASQSDHVLSYAGTTSAVFNINDSQNTILWGSTTSSSLCGTLACHAITVVRYNSQQVFQEVDIVNNDQMDWRTDGTFDSTCSSSVTNPDGTPRLNVAIDTQAIMTHELGHALGIGHTTDSTATMGGASCKVDGRTLNSDDTAALQCLTNRYPVSPDYEGFLDGYAGFNCTQISGWGWNSDRPNDPIYIHVVDGSTRRAAIPADQCRADLVSAGKGNGCHGFIYTVPGTMKNGQWHTVHTLFSGNDGELTWSPRNLICAVKLFPDTLQPTQDLSTGGLPYEVATQFSSSVDGNITRLGYNFSPGETGPHTIRLWTDTGTLLASATLSPSLASYPYVSISPVAIQANVRYRVSITTFTEQSKTPCGLSGGYTSGSLTAHQGFWKQGSGVFPDTSSCSNFHVSVEFSM